LFQYRRAHARKGQIASLDIILSVVALFLFIGIVIAILPMIGGSTEPKETYGGQVFINIENIGIDRPASAFLAGYRVDENKLDNFSNSSYDDIEGFVLANSDIFAPESSDFCMFFQPLSPFNGSSSFGRTYDSPDHTTASKERCNPSDPCQNYAQSFVYARPVLRKGKITKLYVVVCK